MTDRERLDFMLAPSGGTCVSAAVRSRCRQRPLRLAPRVRAQHGDESPEEDDLRAVLGDVECASLPAQLG